MKSILVAVDFSDVTDKVLNQAVELVQVFDAKLTIVHVNPHSPLIVEIDATASLAEAEEASEKQKLQDIHDFLNSKGIEATTDVLKGATVEEIVSEAEKVDADVIVVGSHRHGLFYHFIFGDISISLVGQAPCPVLIVPE